MTWVFKKKTIYILNTFLTNSSRAKKEISSFITKNYYKLIVVE